MNRQDFIKLGLEHLNNKITQVCINNFDLCVDLLDEMYLAVKPKVDIILKADRLTETNLTNLIKEDNLYTLSITYPILFSSTYLAALDYLDKYNTVQEIKEFEEIFRS
jgi:hypothetical protein